MNELASKTLAKVPEVTLGFWIIKVAATTLGETGGDWVTMSLDLGYAAGSAIFAAIFAIAVAAQISRARFHPFLYWAVIAATTTLGTTMADFADRSLGIGYFGGATVLFLLLMASIAVWHRSEGTVRVQAIASPKAESFYWITILFSQTLGTALGDWVAGTDRGGFGLGYETGALVFGAGLALVALAYFFTGVSRVSLFWAAFILTRPLGATAGDLLDKPVAEGGLALNRLYASAILIVFIVLCILLIPQRAGEHPEASRSAR